MKITFVGLSCFMLENSQGGKILLDPFKDSPQFSLGLSFPSSLQADIFLVSHPDDDHSRLTSNMLTKRQPSDKHLTKNSNLFPNLNLKGTLVHEYNGDINIAYSFSLDNIRCLHLADNAHLLTPDQIKQIGPVDVVFVSPPKVPNQNTHIQNIKLLKPKIAVPSHFIPPDLDTQNPRFQEISQSLQHQLNNPNITNPHLNPQTIETFAHMFQYGINLNQHFPHHHQIFDSTIDIDPNHLPKQTTIFLFRKCLGY